MKPNCAFRPFLLVILLTTCFHGGLGIKCWDCRSDTDPHCGDPIDNVSLPITNCNELPDLPEYPGVRPKMCQKTRQKVNGVWTIIRGCAYLGEVGVHGDEKICLSKPRYGEVFSETCTCDSKDGCNTGSMMNSDHLVLLFSGFLAFFAARF